jgi:hypothetical protein
MQAMLKSVTADCAVQVAAAEVAQTEAHAEAAAAAAEEVAAVRANAEVRHACPTRSNLQPSVKLIGCQSVRPWSSFLGLRTVVRG